jgi:outer membrane protein OmpA-like peptidoglycan-associated protein
MSIYDDFSVAVNGDIRHVSGSTHYTVLQLHRFLQDLSDNATTSGNDLLDITSSTPSERSTDEIVRLLSPYNIDDSTAEYLYGGSVRQGSGITEAIYSGLKVLGAVNNTDTQLQITNGPNSMTGRIRFAPHAAAHGATAVVFTVYNTSGRIVSVITRRVKPTEKSASITVRNDGSLSVIRAHTTNKVGVSVSARKGANITRGRTSQGTMADGRPTLRGTAIGETIFFRGNSAELTPRTTAILDKVAKSITTKGGKLFVSGFARKNGLDTPKYLRNLSERRALAVSMYLSSKGVRLWTVYQGFGAVTKEIGTPKERRVEIRWQSLQ